MKRKSLWIVVVMALTMAVGSAVALADVVVLQKDPPPGTGCTCPANYDPVRCTAADGSFHVFSNGCVAACHGYVKCVRITVEE